MKLTPQQLAEYPIKAICTLCDRADEFAPLTTTDLLRQLLTRMPDDQQRALSAAIDSLFLEIRELKEENAQLKAAIASLQNPEQSGGLGDK